MSVSWEEKRQIFFGKQNFITTETYDIKKGYGVEPEKG